jgi:hypothetical protein
MRTAVLLAGLFAHGLPAAMAEEASSRTSEGATRPRLLFGPILTGLGARSARISFGTDRPVTRAFVEARAGKQRLQSADAAGRIFHLTLEGLKPDTRYAYTIHADGMMSGATFGTAPKAAGTFTFLVYGDNRSDDDAHAAVVAAMRREPADFLVHTGDVTQDGNDPNGWLRFFEIERELLATVPLLPAYGNHDGQGFERFYGLREMGSRTSPACARTCSTTAPRASSRSTAPTPAAPRPPGSPTSSTAPGAIACSTCSWPSTIRSTRRAPTGTTPS